MPGAAAQQVMMAPHLGLLPARLGEVASPAHQELVALDAQARQVAPGGDDCAITGHAIGPAGQGPPGW